MQEECNGYYMSKVIGSGSFGVIRLARKDGESFAIKKIPFSRDGVECVREIDTGIRVRHPHLLSLTDFFFSGNYGKGSLYLVMPLADGTLEEYIDNSITIQQRKDLCYQLVSALHCLSVSGVTHGDIKPTNCLMFNGSLKLGDFGLVYHHTDPVDVCQSPLASPPEVVGRISGFSRSKSEWFRQNSTNAAKMDIWALGVTFIFILIGKYPFGCSPQDIVKFQLVYFRDRSRYLDTLGVPREWIPMLLTMLEPDVRLRVRKAETVLDDELFKEYPHDFELQNNLNPLVLSVEDYINNKNSVDSVVSWSDKIFGSGDFCSLARESSLTMFYHMMDDEDHILLFCACLLLSSKLYGTLVDPDDLVSLVPRPRKIDLDDLIEMEKKIILKLGGILYFSTPSSSSIRTLTYHPIVRDVAAYCQLDVTSYVSQLDV